MVFVILDGENAWEHFEGQGRPFLRALYRELTTNPEVRTVTMREACGSPARAHRAPASRFLDPQRLLHLGRSRRRPPRLGSAGPGPPAPRRAARRTGRAWTGRAKSLLVAEGSDWFWWYGDDHSSDHDQAFDQLFRRHLSYAYLAMGDPVPAELLISNITTDAAIRPTSPWVPLSPTLDGDDSSYFEWMGGGWFDTRDVAGAMHQVTQASQPILGIRYGYDNRHLFLCAVPKGAEPVLAPGRSWWFRFPAVNLHLVVAAPRAAWRPGMDAGQATTHAAGVPGGRAGAPWNSRCR